MEGRDPLMDESPFVSFCPEHSRINDCVRRGEDGRKSLEDRVADLAIAQTRTETTVAALVKAIEDDREDRKAERKQEAEEREKDRLVQQDAIRFYQDLVTCNNKASIEERKELVKYGGKVVMILLAAVVGIKLVTTLLGIPFP